MSTHNAISEELQQKLDKARSSQKSLKKFKQKLTKVKPKELDASFHELHEEVFEEDGIDATVLSSELTITGFGATSKGIRLTMTLPLVGTIMVGSIMVHHERMISSLTYAYPVGAASVSDSNALVGGLLNVIINRLEQTQQ